MLRPKVGSSAPTATSVEGARRQGHPLEFLDFECESCRAVFPTVEMLREQNAGKVTFVVRYFPIPSHATR